ncbi:MAG: hypothetical protein P4K80_04640, partial [Acidobacteriaceae bacterium]|nr:hypothetical protein [Acidobacteriaceae bacterium]
IPLGGNTIKTTAKTTATAKADSSATLRNDKQKRGNSSVTKQRVYVDTAWAGIERAFGPWFSAAN